MTDNKRDRQDGHLPVRQDVLPPEPVRPRVNPISVYQPGGVIDSAVSGWVARYQARAIEANNAKLRGQLDNIHISTEIAWALKENIIAWAQLDDIEAIVDADRRRRAFEGMLETVRKKNELAELNYKADEWEMKTEELRQKRWALERAGERQRQNAAALESADRWRARADEEQAHTRFIAQQRDRQLAEAIHSIIISTRKAIEQAKEVEKKYALARSLQILQGAEAAVAGDGGKRSRAALTKVIEEVENRMQLARDRGNMTEAGVCSLIIHDVQKIIDEI